MSKTAIEETSAQLIQYFKEPLMLGPQTASSRQTPESINKQVSKLIFGNPADGARISSAIKPELDERIVKIVAGWPRDFQTDRAHSFGFKSETNFEQIIRIYLEDDLPKVS